MNIFNIEYFVQRTQTTDFILQNSVIMHSRSAGKLDHVYIAKLTAIKTFNKCTHAVRRYAYSYVHRLAALRDYTMRS